MIPEKYMLRYNFYLTQVQKDFLSSMKGLTVSEHIRRAIDEYIGKKKNQNATTSPSEKGGNNEE